MNLYVFFFLPSFLYIYSLACQVTCFLNFVMFLILRGLHAIGIGCKKLKDLTLSDCYFLSDKGLEAIAAGCKELIHLEVNGCHNIGTLGLEFIGKSCPYVSLSA